MQRISALTQTEILAESTNSIDIHNNKVNQQANNLVIKGHGFNWAN